MFYLVLQCKHDPPLQNPIKNNVKCQVKRTPTNWRETHMFYIPHCLYYSSDKFIVSKQWKFTTSAIYFMSVASLVGFSEKI